MSTRRQILGAAAALPVLGQEQYTPKVFKPEELALVRDLAETIIPRTDTPGAADAKVELAIDRALASNSNKLADFRMGLRLVANARKGGQTLAAILKTLADQNHPFFRLLKDLTVDGYYASQEGLARELGWKGMTAMHEWEGCTHAGHKSS